MRARSYGACALRSPASAAGPEDRRRPHAGTLGRVSRLETYLARTPQSRELYERATRVLPGGSTRTTVFTPPYPPYIASGRGIDVRDVDGNAYRDFLGNYTSLILGHAHPGVVAAVEAQVRRGSAFAAPTETEVALAEELCRRLPSVEQVRFTSSGSEATMFAVRAARAFTGRPLIATFERSYHGTHDAVMDGTPGVPDTVATLTIRLPWEDPEGVRAMVRGRERDLAAILVEPVQGAGGIRAASPSFLAVLREVADETGALLVFDEIISFRLGPGGAQGLAGVRPDLTTLGKIIGGGHPLAAFGGRVDVMALRREAAGSADPRRHVQRQSGRCGRWARHAPAADAGRLPRARTPDPATGRQGRGGDRPARRRGEHRDGRLAVPGVLRRDRVGGRDRCERSLGRLPRASARGLPRRAPWHGGDRGGRDRRRRRRARRRARRGARADRHARAGPRVTTGSAGHG